MTDLSVIILVGKEERHIGRCLERLARLEPRQVIVVESQTGDRTHEIAVETAKGLDWRVAGECLNEVGGGRLKVGQWNSESSCCGGVDERCRGGADESDSPSQTFKNSNIQTFLTTVWHDWPGNQAKQFNWVLDFLEGRRKSEEGRSEDGWILRLDADEYLTEELVVEIKRRLSTISNDVDGVLLKRRHYFGGGWAKHGTYPVKILRLFRKGCGRYDPDQEMDERLNVSGKVVLFDNDFVDHSLIPMDEWRAKHRGYAKREAAQAIESLRTGVWTDPRKATYYRLPRYWRAVAYFAIRYFLKGGFLDGYAGWMWNFWQGLWYRWIVDREIGRCRRRGGYGA